MQSFDVTYSQKGYSGRNKYHFSTKQNGAHLDTAGSFFLFTMAYERGVQTVHRYGARSHKKGPLNI
jgi:hypothetical protein